MTYTYDEDPTTPFLEGIASFLLFFLVFGMAATVDVKNLGAQLKNTRAIGTGLLLQFFCMPFLGFLACRVFDLRYEVGLILLVITSSPGGSYSNWFCSLFNADLALSVAMTAISTLLSTIMLPFNLFVYERLVYNNDVNGILHWGTVGITLGIVLAGILSGLAASRLFQFVEFHLWANAVGNCSGVFLLVFSAIVSNSTKGTRLWEHDAKFYFGVAMPCVLGLVVATAVTTYFDLRRPERVTISVECCIQNCGIAISVALSLFDGVELAIATSVPFYYGLVQCVTITAYCLYMWKRGWTKAPKEVSPWKMLITPYEVIPVEVEAETEDDDFCYMDGDAQHDPEDHFVMVPNTKDIQSAYI